MDSVSIIIINWNGAKHLEKCLRSINELDYPKESYEVIIFDNGSVDDSIDIIRKVCPGANILESRENIGFAPPHRIAAEAAKGDVLAFLNNDTRVDSRWIREGISVLDRPKGIVCSASKLMSWNGRHVEFNGGTLQYLGYADQLTANDLKPGDEILFPCGGAMFIYKDVFREADCFDDDYFAIFEDVDLGWRLWVMGYRVVMAPDSIVYHRGHSTLDSQKETKKRFLMHRNALMTIIKNYDDDNLRKILPLALTLAVKRALLFMNIDKKGFYFWEDQAPQAGYRLSMRRGAYTLLRWMMFLRHSGALKKRGRPSRKTGKGMTVISSNFLRTLSETSWDTVNTCGPRVHCSEGFPWTNFSSAVENTRKE